MEGRIVGVVIGAGAAAFYVICALCPDVRGHWHKGQGAPIMSALSCWCWVVSFGSFAVWILVQPLRKSVNERFALVWFAAGSVSLTLCYVRDYWHSRNTKR
jgi:hypothetical protein